MYNETKAGDISPVATGFTVFIGFLLVGISCVLLWGMVLGSLALSGFLEDGATGVGFGVIEVDKVAEGKLGKLTKY